MKYLLLLSIVLLFGCKAKKIDWASECANRYPVKTEIIQGKESIKIDTAYIKGDSIPCDGTIKYVKCPPSKTITVYKDRVDTVVKENTAKISSLQQENKELKDLIHSAQNQTLEAIKIADEEHVKRNKATNQRNAIAFGMVVLIVWNCRKILSKIIFPFV